MALVTATYVRPASLSFQDCVMSKATVIDGTLFQRLDVAAYPQAGTKITGTRADGSPVPAAAKSALF